MELLLIVLVSFVVMALAILGMASGILLGGNAIRGSCGGLNKKEGSCLCAQPCERRKKLARRIAEQGQ